MEIVIQITAPHFCAGLVMRDGFIVKTAPILKYMRGWSYAKMVLYCAKKQWCFQNSSDLKMRLL